MKHKLLQSKYQDSDPVPWGQTEAERIAAGLTKRQRELLLDLCALSDVGLVVEGDEVLARKDCDEDLVEVDIPPTVTWLGRAVAEAIRAQEGRDGA